MRKIKDGAIRTCEDFSADMAILSKFLFANKPVPLEEIPAIFKEDFLKFTYGDTLCKNKNGQMCAFIWDFTGWWHKIRTQGLDYDIIHLDILKAKGG